MAFLAAGQGGVQGHTAQTAQAGNNDIRAATGGKYIGGNPNVQTALQSPWFAVAAVAIVIGVAYLWRRR